ncbi:MAG: arsenic efflux protein [Bacteroidales bacterium]|nr:arsenic efflux protein [Bacteroidales bacterium]
MTELWDIFKEAAVITLVVTALMALVEALDFSGRGRLVTALRRSRAGQLLLGAGLGATPGCIGGYVGVSLYSEGVLSFGALLACFVATTGDEAFLMLARFPVTALWLFAGLFAGGILLGFVWDRLRGGSEAKSPAAGDSGARTAPSEATLHSADSEPASGAVPSGHAAHAGLAAHLRHLLPHAGKIFLWTFGVMAVVAVAEHFIDLQAWMGRNTALMILLATAVGFIPQSGPHMIFVTLFAEGVLPLPVLLASSITQDGHAGLPLLAQSGRAFFRIKCIKAVLALLLSFSLLLIG